MRFRSYFPPSLIAIKGIHMFEVGTAITYAFLFVTLYFEVFLLLSFLDRRRTPHLAALMGSPSERAALPRVTIVVPCFNEGASVDTTMRSLFALQYPKEKLEIFIVDDGSTDDTLSRAQTYASHEHVRVFTKENGGKHTALNFALTHTTGDLIGCLDADSTVAPDALLQIVPVFNNPDIAAVTPGIHVRDPRTLLQHMQHVEYQLSLFNRYIFAWLGSLIVTPGPFSFFRTAIIRELGGWQHGHSTEDMELALRMQHAGHQIANAPSAVVHTTTPATLRGLFHQRVRWTYGWLCNAVDYRFMIGNKNFGNLGLIILPSALFSIAAGLYFFVVLILGSSHDFVRYITRYQATGNFVSTPTLDLFYFDTSAFLFLAAISTLIIVILICIGSFVGSGSKRPPLATPLFLALYSFIAPLWLCTAVVRATLRTGVRWR